ncbi:GNAT family N-acetyltransferase [Eisenibacter elegans]|jgi:GNAT superfamily N-acetyltransferase|uniref:GNAT family N-acetyltransferase n=1 Tax=Eisenibacter elegans TaxID=997 RepID=UPI0003FE3E1A|nr:GNAT family N-acetyltransferase [Eisenibacter elegans]
MKNLTIHPTTPSIAEFQELRQLVGWETLPDLLVEKALAGTIFGICIRHQDQAVACGRIVGDGSLYYYLQDVIVHPDFQHKGLAKMVMAYLLSYLEKNAHPQAIIAWVKQPSIMANFFEQYGFTQRSDSELMVCQNINSSAI